MTSEAFRRLPLSNDFMFGEIMRRDIICRLFLESLLGQEIARIEYHAKQEDISGSETSHGIRMDVYLKDGNTVYCIEMDTSGRMVLFKRIRYYQGAIDRHNLKRGQHYSELVDSVIIVVSTHDVFGRGLAVYEREMSIRGCRDLTYEDGSRVFFLNSAYTTGNAAKPILEYLDCIRTNNTDSAAYESELMKRICPAMEEVRQDEGKEAEYMISETKMMDARWEGEQKGLERGRLEGRVEGRREGRLEGRREGIEEGENTLGKLMALLFAAGRMEDAQKAAVDRNARKALYQEFHFA